MDVENMHPFCLPFSLCHDATSSIMATDDSDSNDCNSDGKTRQEEKPTSRSKTSSPSDDDLQLFGATSLHSARLSSRSLLDDESIIGTTSIDAEDDFYSNIELGADLGLKQTDIIDDDFGFHDDDEPFCKHHQDDDWCSNNYLLLSPNLRGAKSASKHGLAHEHHHLHHHQVFQHVNDPLDIKSSPTLAQLNLNSSDDPNDGLWDTAATSAASTTVANFSCTSTSTTTNSSDLSNSTSIYKGFSSNCTRINPITAPTCNHSHHQHYLSHHLHHDQNNRGSSHHSGELAHFTAQQAPLCQHHMHHFNHGRFGPVQVAQGTCFAGAPFVRNNEHHLSGACTNQPLLHGSSPLVCNGFNESNIPAKSPINHLACRARPQQQQITTADCARLQQESRLPSSQAFAPASQRCASPALVTSSSSPLSSSSTVATPQQPNNANCDGHHPAPTDNKLKENIEYLTALLCNGTHKLDCNPNGNNNNNNNIGSINNNSHSSTISSTMIKSYTTLTQTLSTGPRLLERQQLVVGGQPAPSLVGPKQGGTLNSQPISQVFRQHIAPTGEQAMLNAQRQQQFSAANNLQDASSTMMRPCSEHWFKPAVESSVSVADSTAENQSAAASQQHLIDNHHQAKSKSIPSVLPGGASCAHYFGNNQAQNHFAQESQAQLGTTKQPNELRVLSSLLSSNKSVCPTMAASCNHLAAVPATTGGCNHSPMDTCNTYPAYNPAQPPQMYGQQQASATETTNSQQQDNVSIPPNGRPITLTPIANNGIIVQQQQRAPAKNQASKPKTPLFAQPASPSTSSTTSSMSSTDINSSSSSSSSSTTATSAPSSKRQKTNQLGASEKSGQSNQSGRTNSMSTDCSLSSHDEGFSSQVDNDDCNSTRDSGDDEDEVDSDDESFYGDYTNSDLIGASISDDAECKWTLNMGRTRRNGQKRFFWQYNVQSKGPKGARMCSADGNDDNPFVLPEASDPVFSSDCQIEGVKHSGKARRGDGNDLTPNPRKLLMIGLELKKLGRIINDLVPVTDLPLNARNKTRKEKNKLASRACRLKKKAQHEANKIKLYGLQREHQQVVVAIYDIRKYLLEKLPTIKQGDSNYKEAEQLLRSTVLDSRVGTIADNCSMKVAGQTSDYVNSVLEKVVSGCIDGGLQT